MKDKEFRITFRMEVYIKAEDQEAAQNTWDGIDLGRLKEEELLGQIQNYDFVEEISFDEE